MFARQTCIILPALCRLTRWHVDFLWLQGYETLTSLKILDLSNNRIAALPSLACLMQLQACRCSPFISVFFLI